jgi:RNA polymerase sigma factor (sigma-70 family)
LQNRRGGSKIGQTIDLQSNGRVDWNVDMPEKSDDVLSNEVREQLLKDCKPFIIKWFKEQNLPANIRGVYTAEDFWQEIHQNAWFGSFQGVDDPKKTRSLFLTWVKRIAEHKLQDLRDFYGRRPTLVSTQDSTPNEAVRQAEATDTPPSRKVRRTERHAALLAAKEKLPEPYRTVVELKLKELSAAEIAKQMGITPDHVNVLFERAKKRLRKILGSGSDYYSG